jgi:zinc/manganese transport system ATP-binding protein
MVTLDNLTVSYRQHPALHHVSGSFVPGSMTAVVGPNGAGKSTLLKSIMGLTPISAGTISVSVPRQRIAYLPQLAEIDRGFPIDVVDCVQLGFCGARAAWGGVTQQMAQRALEALHAVGLEGFDRRAIGSLSSGQLQRVLFARMMVQDADLVLLDEPFNAIDARTTAALIALVQKWHTGRRTVVAVLHDDQQVRAHFPDTLLIARELIGWGPTASVLTDSALRRARTMAEAWDESAELCQINSEPNSRVAA